MVPGPASFVGVRPSAVGLDASSQGETIAPPPVASAPPDDVDDASQATTSNDAHSHAARPIPPPMRFTFITIQPVVCLRVSGPRLYSFGPRVAGFGHL